MALRDWLWFIILCVFKYNRLIVQSILYMRYEPIPLATTLSLTPADTVAVIATLGDELENLSGVVRCLVQAGCKSIRICTPSSKFAKVEALKKEIVTRYSDARIEVDMTKLADKRKQLIKAIVNIPRGKYKAIVGVDDDVTFPKLTVSYLLAALEEDNVGAVGTCQRAKRIATGSLSEWMVNWIFRDYIQRRTFENLATLGIDGSISCLSGRLWAVRGDIVQDPEYQRAFLSETFNGRRLSADDDNFLTRWLLERRWVIRVQCHENCQVETTFGTNPEELKRFLRWQRSNPRSNSKSLRHLENWRYPWGTWSLYMSGFVNYGLPIDLMLFKYCFRATAGHVRQKPLVTCFFIWWLFAKMAKRIPLFRKDWRDIIFLPVSIFWGWCHDFIKLYAVLTLNETGW